jgi:hypothetical protein
MDPDAIHSGELGTEMKVALPVQGRVALAQSSRRTRYFLRKLGSVEMQQ